MHRFDAKVRLWPRHINLPDDFARKFVEPVAEVWGKSVIQEIRKRTREFAADCERMVTDLAKWCRDQGAESRPACWMLNSRHCVPISSKSTLRVAR